MNYRAVFMYIGYLLVLEGISMLPALAIAGYHGELASVRAFLIAIVVVVAIGLPLMRRKPKRGVHAREGFVTVGLGWILISLFGALPYLLSGAIPSFVDALFETVSGFSTTGASVLADVESFPRGLLYWRSFTNWLGGMGVLVLVLAVSSLSAGSGEALHLLRAEAPGPSAGKLTPTIKHTARMLYTIYMSLTALMILLLLLGGMPLFDSVAHAFGAAGTGGFSVRNTSIGAYGSMYIEMVTAVFTLLFGTNFMIFHMLLTRRFRAAGQNEELRLYGAFVLLCTIVVSLNILPLYSNFSQALGKGFFHVASILTTTGYYTADYNVWPQLSRYLLLFLMWVGACAGSTTGGLKLSRMLIVWKSLRSQLKTTLRPRAVSPVRMDGKILDDTLVRGVHAYLTAYLLILLLSLLLITRDHGSMETHITAIITCLSNSGPGLDAVGPLGNYAAFSDTSKLVFVADMLIGRLEIFPMLLLFSPAVWKRQA